jgi:hypothetical protein
MRSYGFTLIFVLSRVPDAFIAHYSDQFLGDMLWSLVVVALILTLIVVVISGMFYSARSLAAFGRFFIVVFALAVVILVFTLVVIILVFALVVVILWRKWK